VGDASLLFPVERRTVGAEGLALDPVVPLPSLTLLLVERERGHGPPTPRRVVIEPQPGLTERSNVLIRWTSGPFDGVLLHDVLFATSAAGPYEPVNARALLSSACLHGREREPGFYVVRTRDLTGLLSAQSEPMQAPV
jgi:hypothetical protein